MFVLPRFIEEVVYEENVSIFEIIRVGQIRKIIL
jgi:hypothetical protein